MIHIAYTFVYIYIYVHSVCMYMNRGMFFYTTQLTGCSYLVLQSSHVFWGLTSFSNSAHILNSQMLYLRRLPRSGGVLTSFYDLLILLMMFLTNRGTPQKPIKAVAHIFIYYTIKFFGSPSFLGHDLHKVSVC